MALAPLPISEVTRQSSIKPQLPYPKLGERITNEKPAMQRVWGADKDVPSEESRLKELEDMLQEAQSRAAIVEQEAYDKAYAAGEKAGLALGEKRAEQILSLMTNIVEQAEQELHHLQHQSLDVVLALTTSILEKVMGHQDVMIEQPLKQAIDDAFTQLEITGHHRVVLVVHPHDLDMFTRMEIQEDKLHIKADERISQGSCKLLTPHHDTLIDPQRMIQKAVRHIRQQFEQAYEQNQKVLHG